ncbi:Oxidase FUB9 [Hyphodiscus hymeniophilus]|uniref:Oxidase FUB9 n=1 Tax=Hyphodiscus hymeniophilus TaxID=353542 RepID=A0A9P6VMH7_9HELO|nr:Oxidase FUB9 [Hyphodiscus hymeniophilus]
MANRGPTLDPNVLTIGDLKDIASKKLPIMYRDYFNEGGMDMITLRDNEDVYDRYKIRPRVLVNMSHLDVSTTIFGSKVSFPLGFSPAAMHQLAHPDGEVATSRAAAKHGVAMAVSSYATCSMEDIITQGSGNPYAFQVTILKDRVNFADEWGIGAGYKAILLTVDCVALGLRINEFRNSFTLPVDVKWPNIESKSKASATATDDDSASYVSTPEDVVLAIQYGVDGVIVSNHGGRQLDGVPSTLDSLRDCAPAAAGKIPIAIDGGIRRGSDIFKALALGASFCFVGRVPIWGLAYNGQEGVELAIKLLMNEFNITMALAGCKNVSEISKAHLSLLGPALSKL